MQVSIIKSKQVTIVNLKSKRITPSFKLPKIYQVKNKRHCKLQLFQTTKTIINAFQLQKTKTIITKSGSSCRQFESIHS